jgi:hypothetical protein
MVTLFVDLSTTNTADPRLRFVVKTTDIWRATSRVIIIIIIENGKQYTNLGHIICSSFLDLEDIMFRHNSHVGQTNNFLCFF